MNTQMLIKGNFNAVFWINLIFLITYPLVIAYVLKKNFRKLGGKKTKKKFSLLYANINTKTLWKSMFLPFFFAHKFTFALIPFICQASKGM